MAFTSSPPCARCGVHAPLLGLLLLVVAAAAAAAAAAAGAAAVYATETAPPEAARSPVRRADATAARRADAVPCPARRQPWSAARGAADDKRVLARMLISRADAHKERSLKDVLRERVRGGGGRDKGKKGDVEKDKKDKKSQRKSTGQGEAASGVRMAAHSPLSTEHEPALRPEPEPEPDSTQQREREKELEKKQEALQEEQQQKVRADALEEPVVLRSWSEVFAWAINSTVQHMETVSYPNASHLIFPPERLTTHSISSFQEDVDDDDSIVVEGDESDVHGRRTHASRTRARDNEDIHGVGRLSSVSSSGSSSAAVGIEGSRLPALPDSPSSATAAMMAVRVAHAQRFATWTLQESESDIMLEALRRLEAPDTLPQARVDALLVLEELCHSIDIGVDLHAAGGLRTVVDSMTAREARVRASAAWALGTCAQNNPTVQNASLTLGAVPVLVVMAADDEDVAVCARALLALNALLELTSARDLFEELSLGIQALRRPLVEQTDARATRRALNLAELLVRANLDNWKPQLEAWDLGPVVENLMRNHKDVDVRESAARLISALDGRAAL